MFTYDLSDISLQLQNASQMLTLKKNNTETTYIIKIQLCQVARLCQEIMQHTFKTLKTPEVYHLEVMLSKLFLFDS